MKVCHFIIRMIVGGAQENTFLSARGLVEAGHECVMLCGPSEGREGQLLQRMDNPGFEVVESPLFVREIAPWTDLNAIYFLSDFSGSANLMSCIPTAPKPESSDGSPGGSPEFRWWCIRFTALRSDLMRAV
jgi:hypothetical protein